MKRVKSPPDSKRNCYSRGVDVGMCLAKHPGQLESLRVRQRLFIIKDGAVLCASAEKRRSNVCRPDSSMSVPGRKFRHDGHDVRTRRTQQSLDPGRNWTVTTVSARAPNSLRPKRLMLRYAVPNVAAVVLVVSSSSCTLVTDLPQGVRTFDVGRRRASPSAVAVLQVLRTISNTAPCSLRARIVPPCRSMIALTIDSPRPLPAAARRDASAL